jgi:radical SAM protein with 4Fe4S-binding SPASM domain
MKSEACENKTKEAPEICQESILYSPDLVQFERDDVCLLIDPSSPNWTSTNSSGSAIIRRCDGRRTLQEIAETAGLEFGLHITDVVNFINQAAEAGFISAEPDLTPSYTGRAQVIAPAALEELWIYTNNSCPLHCKHCLVDGGKEAVSPMTATEIKGLVDEALALGAGRIYFTGGEPFLRKDILELVQYVTSRAQLVILTSAVLITTEMAGWLKALSCGNLVVQVSLEGPDAATNDAIRGEGSFERAVAGIRALLGAGITPVVTTTLTRLNYCKAADTTRFLAGLGIKDHHILWLHQCGRMRQSNEELLISSEEIVRTMQRLREAARDAGIIMDNSESLSVRIKGRGHKNDLCNSCYGVLAVSTDAHVYPCASVVSTPEFDCGSVKEKSLREIWLESQKTNLVRGNSVQKKVGCSTCCLKYFCGGGCYAQAYFRYEMTQGKGCIMAPDPYCDVYRSMLLELMWESAMPAPSEKSDGVPIIYRMMEGTLPGCAASRYTTLDGAHDVGTYHCSCVLAMDVPDSEGGSCSGG